MFGDYYQVEDGWVYDPISTGTYARHLLICSTFDKLKPYRDVIEEEMHTCGNTPQDYKVIFNKYKGRAT
jgi:hypothetical protein